MFEPPSADPRAPSRWAWLVGCARLASVLLAAGCDEPREAPVGSASTPAVSTPASAALPTPAAPPSAAPLAPSAPPPPPPPRCPPEMVLVRRAYCVDRYEAVLVHAATEAPLSPYYPPDPKKASYLEKLWREQRGGGTSLEQRTPLPPLPGWQKLASLEPRAESREGAVPQGYASALDAERACKNAGKRLCTREEWRTACRGEQDRDFPYGEAYEAGRCNVFREAHPGIELWGDPSKNHTDPRLNLVSVKGKSLLRRTGATPTCKSDWEGDAIFDMVGNLDEWIDDPEGTFLGGFYARAKKDGCQSAVSSHGASYADYSTGIRCCKDAAPER